MKVFGTLQLAGMILLGATVVTIGLIVLFVELPTVARVILTIVDITVLLSMVIFLVAALLLGNWLANR